MKNQTMVASALLVIVLSSLSFYLPRPVVGPQSWKEVTERAEALNLCCIWPDPQDHNCMVMSTDVISQETARSLVLDETQMRGRIKVYRRGGGYITEPDGRWGCFDLCGDRSLIARLVNR